MLQLCGALLILMCASFVQAGLLMHPRFANTTLTTQRLSYPSASHPVQADSPTTHVLEADAGLATASITGPRTTVSDFATTYTAPISPPSFGMDSFSTPVDWSSLTVAHASTTMESSSKLYFSYDPQQQTSTFATYTGKPCTESTKSYASTSTTTSVVTLYTTVPPDKYAQSSMSEQISRPASSATRSQQISRPKHTYALASDSTTSSTAFVFFTTAQYEQPTSAPSDISESTTSSVPQYTDRGPSSSSTSTSPAAYAPLPDASSQRPSLPSAITETFTYAPRPTTTTPPKLPEIVTQQPGITIVPVRPHAFSYDPLFSSRKDKAEHNDQATVTVTVTEPGVTTTVSAEGTSCA